MNARREILVLGGAGFVGSAHVRVLRDLGHEVVALTRENYASFKGARCDVFINANGNSKKFLSDRDPLWDFDASVRSVAASLLDFRPREYVFLSSGDVYPDASTPSATREDQPIDPAAPSRYGQHKLLAEQLVRGSGKDWLIVRMGEFVGRGLRKNAIFDILTNAPVWLSPDSELQFIDTEAAASLVWRMVSTGITNEIVNLGAAGLLNLGAFHREMGSSSEFVADGRTVRYELSLARLSGLIEGPVPTTSDCVTAFAAGVREGLVVLT